MWQSIYEKIDTLYFCPENYMRKKQQEPILINFILDESGSMAKLKEETISGFNKYIDGLKTENQPYFLSLLKFNSVKMEFLDEETPIENVEPLTSDDYIPGGYTPLRDAISMAITKAENKYAKVITVVMTDGAENSSKEITHSDLLALIKAKEALGWAFVYLGVAIDAWGGENAYKGTTMVCNSQHFSADKVGRASAFTIAQLATRNYANDVEKTHLLFDKSSKMQKPKKIKEKTLI